jgi:hypothetical protein
VAARTPGLLRFAFPEGAGIRDEEVAALGDFKTQWLASEQFGIINTWATVVDANSNTAENCWFERPEVHTFTRNLSRIASSGIGPHSLPSS